MDPEVIGEGEDEHSGSPGPEDRDRISIGPINRRLRPYAEAYRDGGREGLKDYMLDPEHREQAVDDMAFLLDHAPALGEELLNGRRETQRLRKQVTKDHLTGLGNRRSFDQYMEGLNAMYRDDHREQTSLLMLDVDLFKEVNDTHGHIAGDAVLVAVADRIRKNIRGNDDAFRYGGEEFAVVLSDTDYEGAKIVGEHIRKAVEDMGSKYGLVTISIGAATYDPSVDRYLGESTLEGTASEFFVDQADLALYQAKGPKEYRDRSHGRNRVVHFKDMCGVGRGKT